MSIFGSTWGRLSEPVQAKVGEIDSRSLSLQVGLSAMQLDNLGLEQSSPPVRDQRDLLAKVCRNRAKKPDEDTYPEVFVSFGDKKTQAKVYNAFGVLAQKGSAIRISSALARKLGVRQGQKVMLSRA